MDYIKQAHCKFLLLYHIVIVCKFRKKLINSAISSLIKECLKEITIKNNFTILEAETDNDHLHILISAGTKYAPGKIVKIIKQTTTRKILLCHREYLKKHIYGKNVFWSRGYFICSIGNASKDTILKYIREQG